ncbi:fasciclin domain-containing protein [Winogradskyella sp. PG-2]|uniref:fasciclin domain-containing protein n=1 Tax=Winogradskyella sp. PG-2 TaxID=754409 RepID=UPI0004588A71|nr:fasciclin domain-containing protein [Winogradskyella sp. PG-2]BAO74452.1 transforming growth factor-beta induced protein IG-H3 precursor [Winogradskyella sp. PG-2]
MKIISKTFKLLTVFLLVIGMTACSSDDDNTTPPPTTTTIVDLALATNDLSTLVTALTLADGDLVTVLSGNGPFTVLAPTNAAFDTFLAANNFGSIQDVPTDVLSQILLNHVISGEVTSTALAGLGSGYTSTSATGAGGNNISLLFDTSNGVRFNNTASVVNGGADVDADNGVVHIIDAVLGLPDVVDHAINNGGFTALTGALTSENLVTTLQGDGPFTVLAPTDTAFGNFTNPNSNGLANILLNHVLGGVILSTDLVNAGSGYAYTSASGPNDTDLSIYYDTAGGVVFNGAAEVAVADIVGTNGIIHVVDNVIDLPTIATFATTNPALSSLVSALQYADTGAPTVPWIGTVSDVTAGPFTVFAPTNDAFGNVLTELSLSGFGEGTGELNAATTDAVLLNHVVSGNIQSSGLPNGTVTTLGGNITADNTAFTLTDGNSRVSNIVTSLVDIQGINGVVHVIDTVILPAE